MPILVDVRESLADEAVIDDVFSWLRWVDQTFSTYIDGSEIDRIDRGELRLEDAHPVVRRVLERATSSGWRPAATSTPESADASTRRGS